jgi:UDP:flavonoid glycosyltransferase YjiC (YdhE family)
VLADADLVVCHGGSGTTNGVLAAGLPLVVCPLFADQTANAASVERLGAGVVVRSHRRPEGGVATLDSGDVTVLRAAIVSCLGTTGYRQAAQDIASSIGSEPMIDNAIRAFKL